jgi:glutathione synthase/RimK-type ligase-like ATP-grasp enzyme
MSIKIYPYKQGSRSARALADALGGRVLRLQGSTYRYRERDTIINWGASQGWGTRCLNQPAQVSVASNKLTAFQMMRDAGVHVPQFWTNREDIPDDAFPIVCRTILNGHSGRGIVISPDRESLVAAPLYVKYIKKLHEFRIHLGLRNGESIIIAEQRKAIPNGTTPTNTQVRNHDNGYVYVRTGFETPVQVIEQAQAAIAALGLDFGAVDIIWNQHYSQAYVLEVNTAPGLEGQTVEDYTNYFRGFA